MREILKYKVNMSRQVGNPADNRKIFSEIMCQNDIIDRAERWNLVRGEKHDIKTDAQSCKRIVVLLMGISGGLWVEVVSVTNHLIKGITLKIIVNLRV